jgi:hypothetical protein
MTCDQHLSRHTDRRAGVPDDSTPFRPSFVIIHISHCFSKRKNLERNNGICSFACCLLDFLPVLRRLVQSVGAALRAAASRRLCTNVLATRFRIPTFPSQFPLFALDRIWVRPRTALRALDTYRRSPLARVASDHLFVRPDGEIERYVSHWVHIVELYVPQEAFLRRRHHLSQSNIWIE